MIGGPGVDDVFARVTGGGTDSRMTDALGSTIALTDGLGWPADTTYQYGPFGETTQAGTPNDNPYQYTGRENDGDGLYHYRARYYRPDQQRFLSQDPLGLAGGDTNLYTYAANDPLNRTDPLGLFSIGDYIGPNGSFSHYAAGLFDGALVGVPSAAFGSGCWGAAHDLGQFVGAVAGGAGSGLKIAALLAGKGVGRNMGAGALGGAFGGAHTTAGLNPGASGDELATGGVIGAVGGAAGGGLGGAAAGGGTGAGAAAAAGGAAVGESVGVSIGVGTGLGTGGGAGLVARKRGC